MDNLQETYHKYREFLSPDLARLLKISGYGLLEVKAQGCYVYCLVNGEVIKFLDLAAGYGVFNLGHRHPAIIGRVKKQLDRQPLSTKVFFNPVMARLAARLAEIAPGDLKFSFFCNSGAEAVEGALKLARLATGRTQIIATENAFHGKTFGALSASGRSTYSAPFKPLLPDIYHVPFGDLLAMKRIISDRTAAVIVEPVQGEGGIHVAPNGYLREIRKLCTQHRALLIVDEVQTGFGRTGKMFACEHWEVQPDIMTLAKALGGGVIPIGCFMATAEVWQAWKGRPTLHTSTFGGNPLACAAGLATIDVLISEDLPRQAALKGNYFLDELRKIAKSYPDIIREVRGLGLMIGVELTEERFGGSIIIEMARQHVIAVYTVYQPKVIRFEPPLIITYDQINQGLIAFNKALARTHDLFYKN